VRGLLLVWLCACRINFDAQGDAGADTFDTRPGTTITFGERPASQRKGVTTDTRLDENQANANYGGSEDLSIAQFTANGEHSLLRFDLTSIAPGTPVVGARLMLARLDYGDELPGMLRLREVAESWLEGSNTGMPGTGATWSTRDGTIPWSTAGATPAQLLGTIDSADEMVAPIDAALVQRWIDTPATNHGVMLDAVPSVHVHVHASESALLGGAGRPELAVDIVE
jgi:hypothetical protein